MVDNHRLFTAGKQDNSDGKFRRDLRKFRREVTFFIGIEQFPSGKISSGI